VTLGARPEEAAVRRVLIVPTLLVAAAALAACGSSSSSTGSSSGGPYGGGSSSKTTATTAATTGTGASIALSAKDFAFTPTSLSAPAGGGTVKFTNTGTVEHNFTVDGKGISKDAEAGGSATVKVDLPAGTYQFHCKYHPTQMKGTLTVG
jgi:plastocyanin